MTASVQIVADARADMLAWADAARPREACGLLLGHRTGEAFEVRTATLARNLAKEDRCFEVDPGHFVRTVDEVIAQGLEIVGVWHSHPASPAVPSDADRASAWPEHVQLIVGSERTTEASIRAWRGEELRVERHP